MHRCIICTIEKEDTIRLNSMETYMQFRIEKKLNNKLDSGFVCLACRELLRKELEGESGIKIP